MSGIGLPAVAAALIGVGLLFAAVHVAVAIAAVRVLGRELGRRRTLGAVAVRTTVRLRVPFAAMAISTTCLLAGGLVVLLTA